MKSLPRGAQNQLPGRYRFPTAFEKISMGNKSLRVRPIADREIFFQIGQTSQVAGRDGALGIICTTCGRPHYMRDIPQHSVRNDHIYALSQVYACTCIVISQVDSAPLGPSAYSIRNVLTHNGLAIPRNIISIIGPWSLVSQLGSGCLEAGHPSPSRTLRPAQPQGPGGTGVAARRPGVGGRGSESPGGPGPWMIPSPHSHRKINRSLP